MTAKQRLIRALRDGRGRSNPSADDGFTLVELVMAIAIMSIIMGVISVSLFLVLHTADSTSDQISTTRYAQTLGLFLPSDVQTAGSINLLSNATTGCSGGSPGTNILTLASSDGTASVSYRAVVQSNGTYQLQRFNCLNGAASSMHVMAEGMPGTTSAIVSVIRSTLLNSGLKILTLTMNVSVVHGRSAPFTFAVSGYSRTPVPGVTSGLTLVSSANPSTTGNSVTFTATVTNAGTVPTGTVTFSDGATTLGSAVLDGTGAASFATTFNVTGSHNIVAQYGGDGVYNANSATLNQVVNKITPTISITSSANPSTAGTSVTFTATVNKTGPTQPSGTVTFFVDSVQLGSAVTLSNVSVGTSSGITLAGGSHTVSVVYSGDVTYAITTSANYTQTVNFRTSSTALSSGTNPSSAGNSVTFTATVTPTTPMPTGTVTFYDGGVSIGSGNVSGATGKATLAVALHGGSHTITATYNGDTTYSSSTSGNLTQTVNFLSSTTAISASPNPLSAGAQLTVTATVTGSLNNTPTGTVNFYDGATLIGTSGLSGSGNTATASYFTFTMTNGSHTLSATYTGDNDYTSSTSGNVTEVVNARPSTTAITTDSPDPSTVGQTVTLTATVTGTGGITPTGTVTFNDGGTTLSSAALSGSGNVATATITTAALTAGSHNITASYSGDGVYTSSVSVGATHTVQRTSATSVATSGTPTLVGAQVTFTATVTGSGGVTPTGTVTFKDGGTTLGTGVLSGSAGTATATFITLNLSVASHSITATYPGDTNYSASSSGAITQVVTLRTTTAGVASSLNPSSGGSSVTFTATITGSGGITPTGTITFKDGATTIGSGALSGAGSTATATFATSTLAAGSGHTITAVYAGDANYSGSTSAGLVQTVNIRSSITTVVSSLNPSTYGSSVMFTATITGSGSVTPTGTVTFKDGATTLGSSAVGGSGSIGTATFSLSTLSVGTHSTITASYGGDANYSASASGNLSQVVNKGTPTNVVTSSLNPSNSGQSVTLTATVAGSGGVTPTGTVTFMDGATTLGTPTLNAAGQATWPVSTLSIGTHSITAVYNGDSNYNPVTSAALSQHVNGACTFVSGSNSPNPISLFFSGFLAQTTTFTVNTTSGCGTLTLTVSGGRTAPSNRSGGPTTWTWSLPQWTAWSSGNPITINVLNNGIFIGSWTTRAA